MKRLKTRLKTEVATNPPLEKDDGKEKIKFIMENFDFHKVHRVMKIVDWEYYQQSTDSYEIPSFQRIKTAAEHLLSSAAFNSHSEATSGGFQAKRFEDGTLELNFCLETESTIMLTITKEVNENQLQ